MRSFRFALIPRVAVATSVAVASVEACAKPQQADPADASTTTAARVEVAEAGVVETKEAHRITLDLAAASFVASVSDRPAWPESDAGARRMGYLRNGAVVTAYDPPTKNDDCKEGWYELATGGFVCGKVATIDMTSPRVKLAPKQPDRDAGMPYRYGVNVSDGTPLYRRVLNTEDRKRFERLPKAEASEEKDEEPPLAEDETPPPRRGKDKHKEKDKRSTDRNKDPFEGDAGRPQLKELRGHGVLVRKMARGFTVALDREFKAAGARWWRTTFGFAVPFDRIALQNGATKHVGSWFIAQGNAGEAALADLLAFPAPGEDAGTPYVGAVGFVPSGAHKIEITEDDKGAKKVGWGGELPRRSAVLLTGREATVAGVTYQQTSGGFYVRAAELRIAHPQIPADVGEAERWIDVDLTRQELVAFEGRKPVFATLISSGRRNPQDPEHDFPTPPGTYRIREKHITSTMDGDVASDGPYSIEDVPWVMYFQGSYALHGAFWHDAFGNMRSHGCVNLSPEDARTLFGWADPQLPEGWHGVFSKDDSTGSRVVVHEDSAPKRR